MNPNSDNLPLLHRIYINWQGDSKDYLYSMAREYAGGKGWIAIEWVLATNNGSQFGS